MILNISVIALNYYLQYLLCKLLVSLLVSLGINSPICLSSSEASKHLCPAHCLVGILHVIVIVM
uniref:Uncharacterized protein n=1 Tax=Arundo donax TaxID=35708 RepID=A0A0A8ZCR3_ARUDO